MKERDRSFLSDIYKAKCVMQRQTPRPIFLLIEEPHTIELNYEEEKSFSIALRLEGLSV